MRSWALASLAAVLLLGCHEDTDPSGVIGREVFITTWVDLRNAAAEYRGGALPESERTRLLRERGVSEDQLLAFVDTHGEDPRYMLDIWTEVERRMLPTLDNDGTAPMDG
ncbi:MAG: hypothetical protein OXI46_01790 [Gemmatimonadota bacterium]|nr:hypothetical protein [Gemmatimonadota bacterium]